MNRNQNDFFSKTPTPHFPRSRFDMGVHRRLQTQGHGRLYPFFSRVVYPGDTWQMDTSIFCRMDTSFRVPLDDIYLDTYFFFVPFRIIDKNFAKVLGEVEPYDETTYSFPVSTVSVSYQQSASSTVNVIWGINGLIGYLGYSQADSTTYGNGFYFNHSHDICSYPFAAYYKIYNDWFRDENVDPTIPYEDLYNQNLGYMMSRAGWTIFDNGDCLKVNKFHDYFTSAMISPQKGPAVSIPLGLSAPVGTALDHDPVATTSGGLPYALRFKHWDTSTSAEVPVSNGVMVNPSDTAHAGFTTSLRGTANADALIDELDAEILDGNTDNYSFMHPSNLWADLRSAAGTINQLRLAFAIQSLYERRGRYGTRYIETIRGQWGIEVPDSFFERPEYLGGSRVTLNNVPVLSTENSSQLGQMAGNSATLSGGNSFTKTFIEYGIILGLSCTRIKHSYTQGFNKELFGLKDSLDLYNPVFANIGFMPIELNEIYNQGDDNSDVFAYQEAWSYLRTQTDSFAGLFGVLSSNTEIKNKWHYGDYYAAAPTFSADWLKEDYKNVSRTLTGQLINGAGSTETEGHQFMMAYYFHPVVTRILPSHSVPAELLGRL